MHECNVSQRLCSVFSFEGCCEHTLAALPPHLRSQAAIIVIEELSWDLSRRSHLQFKDNCQPVAPDWAVICRAAHKLASLIHEQKLHGLLPCFGG